MKMIAKDLEDAKILALMADMEAGGTMLHDMIETSCGEVRDGLLDILEHAAHYRARARRIGRSRDRRAATRGTLVLDAETLRACGVRPQEAIDPRSVVAFYENDRSAA